MDKQEIISLPEWAKLVGIDPATARQKALRGTIPAFKIGRNWVIDKNTPNTDKRKADI